MGGHDRRIVLVDQDHRVAVVVFAQVEGQLTQGGGHVVVNPLFSQYSPELCPLDLRESCAVRKVAVALVLGGDLAFKGLVALVPRELLHIVQREVHHRPHALLRPIPTPCGVPYAQPLKERGARDPVAGQLKNARSMVMARVLPKRRGRQNNVTA